MPKKSEQTPKRAAARAEIKARVRRLSSVLGLTEDEIFTLAIELLEKRTAEHLFEGGRERGAMAALSSATAELGRAVEMVALAVNRLDRTVLLSQLPRLTGVASTFEA